MADAPDPSPIGTLERAGARPRPWQAAATPPAALSPAPLPPTALSPAPLPPTALSPGAVALLAYRRRTFRFGAALIAACYLIDLFQPHFWEVAIVRALWVAAVLVGAALQSPERPVRATGASHATSLVTAAAVVAIVALDGGTTSIYAGMLLATPFAMLVTMVELPVAAAINGGLCVLGGAAMRAWEGQPWTQVAAWLLLSTVMSALATWGTVAARAAFQIELGAERARQRAQDALAESELQRARSERLAEVGRLAARVAHEVNNPLAVVKSNVQWLGQFGPPEGAAERAEVVADTLESVQRIVTAVDSVRRQAGLRPYRPSEAGEAPLPGEDDPA